jgi:hypothetical protein
MRVRLRIAVILSLLSITALPAAAAPLLLNGTFESGDLSGWTATPWCACGFSLFNVQSRNPHTGTYDMAFGGLNVLGRDNEDTIAQSIETTVGEYYTLEFWLRQDSPPCNPGSLFSCLANDFSVLWNGSRVFFRQSLPPGDYIEYSVLVLATGPISTVAFAAANQTGWYRLDDVTLSHVPEPSSLMLLAGGLAAWLKLSRGRRQDKEPVSSNACTR